MEKESQTAMVLRSSFEQLVFSYIKYMVKNKSNNDILKLLKSCGYGIGVKLGLNYGCKFDKVSQDIVFKIRYICKEIWNDLFGKIIDTLQTDHEGVFILHDNDFQLFQTVSSNSETEETKFLTYCLTFVEGVIKGIVELFLSKLQIFHKIHPFDSNLTIKSVPRKSTQRSIFSQDGRRRVLFHIKLL